MTVEPASTANAKLPTLDRFREINATFPETSQVLDFKRNGGKVFGWLCTYTPEEVMHAAGILPVRITGYTQETELDDGTAYLYVNSCSFSRSCLQMALRGGYDLLDGVVGGSTCDGVRRLFDLWRNYLATPFYHVLTVPRKYTERAQQLYFHEVQAFTRHLEEWLGAEIGDDALRRSVELYNETRRQLRQLYDLRRRDQPPITGAETLEVLTAGFRMPREEYNQWLGDFLSEVAASGESHGSRARLMLIGSVLTNPEFIRSIESQGGLIVTDELCTSTRYWGDPVVLDESRPVLESISRRYLSNFPCARMYPSDERFDRIVEACHDHRVNGVVSQTIRYCVPYCHDLPLLTARLKKEGIPVLALDVEYGTPGSGQVQTRVQAFLEMLEARRR
ncbi:MAG: 2-hydroxyacyl-CoA dehydratase family protein [Dehalococcoidales bacterium]